MESGPGIIGLLVPITFRSSWKVHAEVVHELREVGTGRAMSALESCFCFAAVLTTR
jgi:hypothetical protein